MHVYACIRLINIGVKEFCQNKYKLNLIYPSIKPHIQETITSHDSKQSAMSLWCLSSDRVKVVKVGNCTTHFLQSCMRLWPIKGRDLLFKWFDLIWKIERNKITNNLLCELSLALNPFDFDSSLNVYTSFVIKRAFKVNFHFSVAWKQ